MLLRGLYPHTEKGKERLGDSLPVTMRPLNGNIPSAPPQGLRVLVDKASISVKMLHNKGVQCF